MSESTNAILQQAHELIEANQHESAQELLAPLLESETENPAFWWVYAHAVSDSALGDAALDRVLQLDPTYPGARDLKEEVLAARAVVAQEIDADRGPLAGTAFAEDPSVDDWETLRPELEGASESAGAGRGFVLLIVALLIGASGLLLVLSGVVDLQELQSLFGLSTPEAVVVVSVSTAEPTQPEDAESLATTAATPATAIPATEPAAIPTEMASPQPESPTLDPTTESTSTPAATATATVAPAALDEFIAMIGDGVSGFEIDVAQTSLRSTALGETLDMFVCAAPGDEFNARLNGVMNSALHQLARMPTDIDAFAVSLVNCADSNATARTIGVSREAMAALVAGDIDRKTFQQAWQPLS